MSKEGGDDLKNLLLERAQAAVKIENRLREIGAHIADVLTVRYKNGTDRTAPFNGWIKTKAGSKYLRLGTGSVPPVYIASIEKAS